MAYKLKEVQIELPSGIVVTAEVSAVDDVKQLLKELGELDLGKRHSGDNGEPRHAEGKTPRTDDDTPESRIEARAGLGSGILRAKNVLGFKDGIPQLLRPSSFGSVAEATVALLFSVEAGLKKNSIEFDAFKALYESQNIKSGSPVSMLVTNLKNAQYLDPKLYSSERKLRLTAKGENKAIEVLKGMAGG